MKHINEVSTLNQMAEEKLFSIQRNIEEVRISEGNNTSLILQKLEDEKNNWEEILSKSEHKDVVNGIAVKYNGKLYYEGNFEFFRSFESKIVSAMEIGIDESPFIQERDKWLKSQKVTVQDIECAMELFESRHMGEFEFEFTFHEEANNILAS